MVVRRSTVFGLVQLRSPGMVSTLLSVQPPTFAPATGLIGVITFFRTIFPAKPSQSENEPRHSLLSRKQNLLAPLDVWFVSVQRGAVRPTDEMDKRFGVSTF